MSNNILNQNTDPIAIALCREVCLRRSFQDAHYVQHPYLIQCDHQGNAYLTHGKPPFTRTQHQENVIYQFVITITNDLLIGKANHNIISGNAPFVKAAGDIHVDPEGKIIKIDDRAGSYVISDSDPFVLEKRQTALNAMKAMGLPMDRFVPFKAAPLLFSDKSQQFSKILPSSNEQSPATLQKMVR